MLGRKNKKINNEIIFNTKSSAHFDDSLEKPLEKKIFNFYIFFILLIFSLFSWKLYQMQIIQSGEYLEKAKNNFIKSEVLFSDRGIIVDRNGMELVWNENKTNKEFSERKYIVNSGLSHILGFLSYPKKDKSGNYFTEEYVGKAGVEKYFNNHLNGELGKKIIKIDAKQNIISENSVIKSGVGNNLKLTIDFKLQKSLAESLQKYIEQEGFIGASGLIMDVKTGEIISSISLPEYNPNILTDGVDKLKIKEYLVDERNILLNRSFIGGYTPGSVVKPFIGLMALEEKIVKANQYFKTSGKLILPNRWNPEKPTIFSDWKNHGRVNLYDAIAKSSNVYFYIVGGGLNGIEGYSNRKGLGIEKIKKGYSDFGFGEKTEIERFKEKTGLVPDREWKEKVFGKDWNVGNTYFTSIGQFGFLTTPLQLVVAIGAIANEGTILRPVISELGKQGDIKKELNYSKENFEHIKKAMRQTVTSGTTQSLNVDFVKFATKSGTAQIKNNTKVNSWVTGFWPYENPKYAFILLADEGPKEYKQSVSWAMRWFIDSLKEQGLDRYFE